MSESLPPDQPIILATQTRTTVASTVALTVAATAVAIALGMSSSMLAFAAAGVNPMAPAQGDTALIAVEDQFVRGNANDDGYVNVSDANFIINYVQNHGPAPACGDAADANDDGHIDAADARYLLAYLFSGGPAPISPWPGRGVDPTPDTLRCKALVSKPLVVSRAASSPDAMLLPQLTSGLVVGSLRFSAGPTAVALKQFSLTATQVGSPRSSNGAWGPIAGVAIYDGSTPLLSIVPPNHAGAVIIQLPQPLAIAARTSRELTIKVDTARVSRYGSAAPAYPGQDFVLALGPSTAIVATANGLPLSTADMNTEDADLRDMTVYVSTPTVTPNDQLGAKGVAGGILATATAKDVYRFAVSADSTGDIGLFGVSFLVTTSTATATKLTLTDGTRAVAATPISTQVVSDGDIGNVELFSLLFTKDGLAPRIGSSNLQPFTVAAGTTKQFTLRADLLCTATGNPCTGYIGSGSAQFQLLGDNRQSATYPASAPSLRADAWHGHFIWSDYDISGPLGTASTTAATAEQWLNAFRVRSAVGLLAPTSTPTSFSR